MKPVILTAIEGNPVKLTTSEAPMGSPGAPLDPERIPPDRGPGPPDGPSPLPRPGSPGSPIEASNPPPSSYGVRRCPCHRRVLRRPNSGVLSDTSARTVRTSLVAMPIGKVRPEHREATRGGCKRALERTVLLKGGLHPPTRSTRPRGSTTAGRDRIDALGRRLRQTGEVGWIANEADPGGGGRSRARPAWRLATIHAAKGAPGDRPGAANEP